MTTMILLFIIITLSFLIFIIILFNCRTILEIIKPKDDKPLHINMDYIRDVRYFKNSFENKIRGIILNNIKVNNDSLLISCPKLNEKYVEVRENTVISNKKVCNVLFVKKEFYASFSYFEKEVYVINKATINNCVFRVLACQNYIDAFSGKIEVTRWIDAKKIIIGPDSDVHYLSASLAVIFPFSTFYSINAEKIIFLSKNSTDNIKIIRDSYRYKVQINNERKINYHVKIDKTYEYYESDTIIFANAYYSNSIIAEGKLIINQNCIIFGDIKGFDDIIINSNVQIYGNVISEKSIYIDSNCRIYGNVFACKNITLKPKVIIGSIEKYESIIGYGKIEVYVPCTIFGRIQANDGIYVKDE